MNKRLLLLVLLLTPSCLDLSRSKEFYRKKCIYNSQRLDACESYYHLTKTDKTPEKMRAELEERIKNDKRLKAEEKPQIEAPQPKIAEPKAPTPANPAIETKKSAEELKYQEWMKSIEQSVGPLNEEKKN